MMITEETLDTLTQFSAAALTRAINDAGYHEDSFLSARFVGITNGGQFCYQTHYKDIDGELALGKVFLTYDQAAGTVKADY
jgi:hypothetical protein